MDEDSPSNEMPDGMPADPFLTFGLSLGFVHANGRINLDGQDLVLMLRTRAVKTDPHSDEFKILNNVADQIQSAVWYYIHQIEEHMREHMEEARREHAMIEAHMAAHHPEVSFESDDS